MKERKSYISYKALWPGFIPPQENELFSSWIIRLSREHVLKSHSFSKIYFDNHPLWNRDIDRMYPEHIINTIEKHTLLEKSQILNLFLHSYTDRLFINYSLSSSKVEGILHLGINHRKRHSFGMLYCAGCLGRDLPYYKKEWRLLSSLICTDCGQYLQDRCPQCLEPVTFYRLETGYKNNILEFPLNLCSYCFYDLSSNSLPVKEHNLLDYQRYINETLLVGYNKHTNYSFLFFPVLFNLAKKLVGRAKVNMRIKYAASSYFELDLKDKSTIDGNIEHRRLILGLAFRLLSNWPHTFIDFCCKYNLYLSYWSRDVKYTPYWFDRVFKDQI